MDQQTVYVRFVRKANTTDGIELMGGMHLPFHALPRQGDYLAIQWDENNSSGSLVEMVTWHYKKSWDRTGMVEVVEVQLA
jgi:hypothetical protein